MFELELILRDPSGQIVAGSEIALSKVEFMETPSAAICRRYLQSAVESLKEQAE